MNGIQMYSSSADLRLGLHRFLATALSLSAPVEDGVDVAWWRELSDDLQARARTHDLSLEELSEVLLRSEVLDRIDAARHLLGLGPLDRAALPVLFERAIISGRAHRAHGGRDVYGTSNKALFDAICLDFGQAVARWWSAQVGGAFVPDAGRAPTPETLDLLRTFTAFDTSPEGEDHDACVAWLSEQLRSLGFSIEVRGAELGQPLIVAHREGRGLAGHAVLYGHYDVTSYSREARWQHPPRELTEADGRLWARGVADDKGPLVCRLDALARLEQTPEITWLIQGEEETGSGVAWSLFPELMAKLDPTVWVDETGYHDHEDGTLRLIARTVGPNASTAPIDAELEDLLRGLRALASRWGIAARHENRGLNKDVVEGGCPFDHHLPTEARYVALGVNDSLARIHGMNESVPAWTFSLHAAQLDLLFRWTDRAARCA